MLISFEYKGKNFSGIDPQNRDSLSVLSEYDIPQSVIENAISTAKIENIRFARKQAYDIESDPLYMEWQYDQTEEKQQIWRTKVAEIKARYPLPTKE
ncbi:hypothetical protein IHC93_07575 [Photobacterium damselae subsp. damselae]|uniref:hypothetical protein n=1 Tax=Photobacterium damselae TaxID=38293 RepID=UPI001F22396C|nr:hypothetical protein [Photobacterium damselae]UKA26696.1 hypothetical protein IHC93_07575 [Photobacterium damselae subsp. damselae]